MRAGTLGTRSLGIALQNASKIRRERHGVCLKQPRFRDDHDVPSGPAGLIEPEHLSNQSLGAVSLDRSSQPARGDDPETCVREAVLQDHGRHIAARRAGAVLVDALELRAAPNPFVRPERGHLQRQALPALGAAALQNQAAVLRAHPHEKSMGAPAAAIVRLKCSLHGW